MTYARTPADDLMVAAETDLAAALQEAGLRVEPGPAGQLVASLDGREVPIRVVAAAYATIDRVAGLVHGADPAVPVLVADRVTSGAGALLREAGWGYLDRRGQLRLRAPGIVVDSTIAPLTRGEHAPREPIAGGAGLAIAYRLLVRPFEAVTRTRSSLGFAPSTISVALRRLRDAGLVQDDGRGVTPELFWATAETWSPARTWLLAPPDPAEAVWHDPHRRGWCLSGTAAAVELGAPVVTTSPPPDLYVPGPVDVTIAMRRYGVAPDPSLAAASVAAAPVAEVTASRLPPGRQPWPVAHPVAIALDLAQDRARGREILKAWKPPERVW